MNRLPESPIKMEAGLKLWRRNPSSPPIMTTAATRSTGSLIAPNATARLASAIPATPAASPSTPSMRLIAFITPTIQTSVIGIANRACVYGSAPINGTAVRSIR